VKHGSLFSGIGGFDLAAQWMGWENAFHCEIAEFPRKVLNHYWPNALSYENIKETDFTEWRGKIDVISGGFPCQPYSLAGKRLGKEDDRHLWPEMLRCIREIKPRWVVGENVFGLVNWNGALVFDEVQSDLEAEGYEVQAYILPACGVNAPHRRDRVWFVAYRNIEQRKQGETGFQPEFVDGGKITPDPDSSRFPLNTCGKLTGISGQDATFKGSAACGIHAAGNGWQKFPTQSPVCRRDDGLSSQLDGITFPKWRNESIKAYGNAVVPQVVYQIFKAIEAYEPY
jgi:DNA (cytosine-5)-methyltransferase 1